VLRPEDFVRVVANWRPKDENLAELAESLNLGVDSFVFADDNPFEQGLVRRSLPAVAVVALDGEPALHTTRLLRDGWFDTRESTAEDRARPDLYRQELARDDFRGGFGSLDDYLAELGIRVRLARAEPRDFPRISQITLRTNQFNLTTERLQPAEVTALAQDPDRLVLALRSADRFGDNGLVGAVFLSRGEELRIDNFLLSCRVFSRGIEQAALAGVLRLAAADGSRAVLGGYRPTAKNRIVRDFYPSHGFAQIDAPAAEPGETGDSAVQYRRSTDEPLATPPHVEFEFEFEADLAVNTAG
jgi:FkbH-like protein